jgi:hypothetical protein
VSFDWSFAELFRKFIPLERQVTGTLACLACSFRVNDFGLVDGIRVPNVLRDVVAKKTHGYELSCGHVVAPLILRDGERLEGE